jgi:aspartate-semialdehyde dehydrogenase
MKIGIVGATGLIGRTFLSVLEKSTFPVDLVYLSATEHSEGKDQIFQNKHYKIVNTTRKVVQQECDLVVLASDSEVSSRWSPIIQNHSTWTLDISSAHRDDLSIPLVVPEINGDILQNYKGIVSNPNCSTIQLTKAVVPIQKLFGLEKIVVSTYQSISGMGQKGLAFFHAEKNLPVADSPLSKNCTPYIGPMQNNGYCQEEMKMIHESRRILSDHALPIYPTTVRVPIEVTHGESVYIETSKEIEMDSLLDSIQQTPFLKHDETSIRTVDAINTNQVHIGRLRKIDSHAIHFWCIADNLLVGSAWNAFQIVQYVERRIV